MKNLSVKQQAWKLPGKNNFWEINKSRSHKLINNSNATARVRSRQITTFLSKYDAPVLPNATSYQALCQQFKWNIPEYYNIGVDICDKHAAVRPHDEALIYENDKGQVETFSFLRLQEMSNKLANALKHHSVERGDRVGILLGQTPETLVSHIATYKLGCVTVPLFTLFGPEALEYRLQNSEAKVLITDSSNLEKIQQIRSKLPNLKLIVVVDGPGSSQDVKSFHDLIENGSSNFSPVATKANDPALIIFTSGTTGSPKGVLHAHRVLLGHLPGVEFPHNLFPVHHEDIKGKTTQIKRLCFYTPADWAWIGGLCDVLLPSLHYGVPVLAHREKKFDAERTYSLMQRHGVTNAFMPPTSLKMMRGAGIKPSNFILSIGSGGESLGEELLTWGKNTFNTVINEFYGQTEANLLVGNCSKIMPIKPGYMGFAIPGRIVDVVDDNGQVVKEGTSGNIAVKRPDPVMFLEYWKNPKATAEKFIGDWMITGDLAVKESDGGLVRFKFVGRSDDLIKSGGYRIGPSEIENCIQQHPSCAMCAVVGVPDALRNEIVKAFIILNEPYKQKDANALKQEIQNFVKARLAYYEYPREIEFVTELPMTTTGKIIRKALKQREIEKHNKK